ncbi:LppX_LprAFG lipoprotein [Intrasporangium calvum]|uniref:LppX_LprAFG lipoprotein n=1 Tax=Intrasporangium calvum TaxID=53358 RepID=A0ABT5GFT3_9MICO|nr:LppX_LprAFG lipoprotein [Intrasporangium calvum]MDC5696761.1 LppX_LprAFG lipoprotein [Intrasporangium calvum]
MRTKPKLAAAVLSVLAALAVTGLAACTSDEGSDPGPTAPTAAQRLAAAKAKLDAAPSVHLALNSSGVPKDANGVLSGDGWGTHPPAFKGTLKGRFSGIPADVEIVSVGGEVWAKLPLIPGMNKLNPETFGVPDPAMLFSTDQGLSSLLTATQSPVEGDKTRNGAEVLTTITGTLPGSNVVDLFLIGDRNGSFQTSYGLTDDNELRQVALSGPFFGVGTSSTYTVTLDQYGTPVTITKP